MDWSRALAAHCHTTVTWRSCPGVVYVTERHKPMSNYVATLIWLTCFILLVPLSRFLMDAWCFTNAS